MAEKLAEIFNTKHVPEYGREYTDNHKIEVLSDIDYIAIGHVQRAHQIALDNAKNFPNSKILILDTDLITTQIWSEIYFKEVPYYAKSLQDDYIQKEDLYLLMDIDIPWIDDGTREFPYLRKWHFSRIRKELEDRHLPYSIISGVDNRRIDNAVGRISQRYNLII
jgi:NadR type nicotinamide-nucleotide adenylyltransferase